MTTKLTELRLIARTHTRTAVAVLVGIMRCATAPAAARIAAANSLLDRGWGRPAQMLASDDGNPVAVRITEIVNNIVAPKEPVDGPVLAGETHVPQVSGPTAAPELAEADRHETSVETQ